MNKENRVILVDENDNEIGTEEKIKAHVEGMLHRAFSIFIFNDKNELLLQQRDLGKYHSGGLWTNTVCSHPSPGENLEEACDRRLMEEMGFTCPTTKAFSFLYKSPFENGLTEHEIDHVFVGHYNDEPQPVAEEVMAYKWIRFEALQEDMKKHPEKYTTWFRIIMEGKTDFTFLTQKYV